MKSIICILLISSVFSVGLRQQEFLKTHLKPMPNYAHVLAEIRTMMQTGNSYTRVMDLIKDIEVQLVAEMEAQTAIYEAQMIDCDDEMSLRQGEMEEASSARSISEQKLNACTEADLEAVTEENQLTNALQTKRVQLEKENSLRGLQRQSFEHHEAELLQMIVTIQDAQAIVAELQGTVSTEQMENPQGMLAFTQITSKLAMHGVSSHVGFEKITPILISMASMAGQFGVVGAEGEDVGTLVAMLDELLRGTRTQLENIRVEEQDRINLYNQLVQQLNDLMCRIQFELDEIELARMEFERCINTEDSVIAAAVAKFNRNEGIYHATDEMCTLFAQEYHEAENARRSEHNLLQALQTMLQAKINEDYQQHGFGIVEDLDNLERIEEDYTFEAFEFEGN